MYVGVYLKFKFIFIKLKQLFCYKFKTDANNVATLSLLSNPHPLTDWHWNLASYFLSVIIFTVIHFYIIVMNNVHIPTTLYCLLSCSFFYLCNVVLACDCGANIW